jgi:hypothetical protein
MAQSFSLSEQASGNLPLATKNVLLVTCMDLRLLDDVVHFMDGENLTNRYDQFISAGASLSLSRPGSDQDDTFAACRHAFYDHLELAVALHEVKYVYIIEHMNCGAYRYVAEGACVGGEYCGSPEWNESKEAAAQRRTAAAFVAQVEGYCRLRQSDPATIPAHDGDARLRPYRAPGDSETIRQLTDLIQCIYSDRYLRPPSPKDWKLSVQAFRMDLRGKVEHLPGPGTRHRTKSSNPRSRASGDGAGSRIRKTR